MQSPARPASLRYGGALAAVVLATVVRLALDPVLGDLFPFATLFFAVLIVAGSGGRGPALLATVLGALASARFLLPPRGSFALRGVEHQAGMVLYLAIGTGIALLGGALRDSRRRSEREADEAVKQREQLRTTLASIGDAVLVTDAEGRVTSMNPVAEALIGWTSAEAARRPLSSVFRIVHEETRREVEDPARRALREGTIVGLANHTVLIARDGSERAIDDSAAPVRGAGGIVGAVLVFRDVTGRRQAEKVLAEGERRLRMALDAARMVAWEWDPADGSLHVSENAADVFGLPRGTTLIRIDEGLNLVHPDDLAAYRQTYREAIEGRGSYRIHYRLVRPDDGAVLWMEERGQAVCDDSGEVVRLVGVVMDISDRKRAEEGMREARSRLESTLSAGEVGTWEFDVSANVVRADRNLARMFGMAADEAAGGPLESYTRAIHPDDRGRVATAIGRALESGERFEEEYRLVGPGGAVRWVVARGRVVRDGPGRGVKMPGVVVDITGRKRAEEEHARLVAASERQRLTYETALSNTPDFHYTFDLEGRFTFVNASLLHLWRKGLDEVVGRGFLELGYPPDLADRMQRQIGRVIDTKQPVLDETPFTSHLGERQYEYIFVPVINEAGSVEGVAGSTRDITDRKALEDELRRAAADLSEADLRKDEFLATLAHELRNPLAPIRNGLHIMKVAEGDPQAVVEARTLMERQVTHMVRLIDDLMDVSRITRGKLELRKEHVELATVVQSAVDTSRPLFEAAGHELAVTLPARPVVVDADVTRLSQVFSNLLNNAAKYTERGGDIALVAERQGSDVVVTVRDDGVGIPAEMLPKVFNMFTQVDRSLERSQGGLGIGLSLVRTLVEMHGGSVEARSGGHGLGSEFVVRLPIVPVAPTRAAAPEVDVRSAGVAAALRILVVDDNRDSARTLARLLKLLGHEARAALDGGEAVVVAEEYRPDLILLDIGLPVMNGYEVARVIRESPWGRDVAIVALTGWGQEGDRRRSKEAGFDRHLVKPVHPADLEKILAELESPSAGR